MENLPSDLSPFNLEFITESASRTFIHISDNEKETKLGALKSAERQSEIELEKFNKSIDANYKIKDKVVSHQNFKEKVIIFSVLGIVVFSIVLISIGNPFGYEILKLSATGIISFYAGSAYGKKNSQKEK